MACIEELPVFDKGTSLEFTIRDCGEDPDPVTGEYPLLDLTGVDIINIILAKRDDADTVIEREGEVLGDAGNGVVRYITEGTEIDYISTWKGQAFVTFNTIPPGEYQSSIIEIPVVATLRHPEN